MDQGGSLACANEECRPIGIDTDSNKQRKIHEMRISQLDNGYIVNVGCKSFAIEKKDDLITKLTEYINSPATSEEKYFSGKLF